MRDRPKFLQRNTKTIKIEGPAFLKKNAKTIPKDNDFFDKWKGNFNLDTQEDLEKAVHYIKELIREGEEEEKEKL
ncbi:MAG: hypothetical protein L3V56_12430 [Candidatus Magnetoovum sp. WYHC-5]|nr:hypothetical protein [Candidatus Magnetoovum sp. WYHC-5]